MAVFSRFLSIDVPASLTCGTDRKNPAFEIGFIADGEIPFPQVILHGDGGQRLINGEAIRVSSRTKDEVAYMASVPAGIFRPGEVTVQVEGCRQADIGHAGGDEWRKEFGKLTLTAAARPATRPRASAAGSTQPKLYFGIHKHMHQPYYNTTDRYYWDGERTGSSVPAAGLTPASSRRRCISTPAAACRMAVCRRAGPAR